MPLFRVQMARTEYFDLRYEAETVDEAIQMAMAEDQSSIYELTHDNPFEIESDDWSFNYAEQLA